MSATADEVTVDLNAADAEKAKKEANGAATEAPVVVDAEVTERPAAKEAVTTDDAVKKLREQLESEKAARIAAENRANEASRGEVDARTAVQKAQLDQIKGAIEQTNQQLTVAKAEMVAAATAGDWAAHAEAQTKVARSAARLEHLEAGKTALEKAPPPAPRAAVDPVEAFCAQLTPASASWVRAHPMFVTDKQKHAQMIAAHELAVARNLKADTPEYFKDIEKTLDLVAPTRLPPSTDDPTPAAEDPLKSDPAQEAAEATGGRGASPPAAPPSRGGNGTGSTRGNRVTLTRDEVEMAGNMGMTPEEYARNKLALKKEGKLS